MSPTKLVDGEQVEITEQEYQEDHATWEYYRGPSGEPFGREVTPDGTVLQQDVLVDEEVVAEQERQELRQQLAGDAANAITTLSGNAQGMAALDLLIMISHGLGPIPLNFARNNGWVEPWNRA